MGRNYLIWIFAFLLAVNTASAQLPDLTQTTLGCSLEREENGCFFYNCLDPEPILTIEDANYINVFPIYHTGKVVLRKGNTFDCTLDSGDYTLTSLLYGSNQIYVAAEDNNLYVERRNKPDLNQQRDSDFIILPLAPDISTNSELNILTQDITFYSSPQRVTRELSIRDPPDITVTLPPPDLSYVPVPPPPNTPIGETPKISTKEKTDIRSSNGNIDLKSEKITEIEKTILLEVTRPGEFPSRIYGNTRLSNINLENSIKVNPGDLLRIDSSKSFDRYGLIPAERKTWFVIKDVTEDELKRNIDSLPRKDIFFIFGVFDSYADKKTYSYDPFNEGGFDYNNIIEHNFEGLHLDRFVVALLVEDFITEFPQLEIFEVELDRDLEQVEEDLSTEGDSEDRERDSTVRDPSDRTPRDEPISTQFNPSNFPTTDQPQPPGTRAYNGRWVPLQVSSWSCQETDGFSGDPTHNSPLISSTCSVSNELKTKGGCSEDYTHSIEYSCNDNCASPTLVVCPPDTVCSLGKCIEPLLVNEEDFEFTSSGIELIALSPSNDVLTFDNNDIINAAICGGLGVELSQLNPVEIQSPKATAAAVTDVTGFFSKLTGFFTKVTGKQTAEIDSSRFRFFIELTDSKYSEIANSPNPYKDVSYTNYPISRDLENKKARILDRKLGSALLDSFDYSQNDIDAITLSDSDFTKKNPSNPLTVRKWRFGSSSNYLNYLTLDDYASLGVEALATYRGYKYLLVETEENRYFEIDNDVYSVAAGFYLVPYPIDDSIKYERLNFPEENNKLAPYYESISSRRIMKISEGGYERDGIFLVPTQPRYAILLTPLEAEHLMQLLPDNFNEIARGLSGYSRVGVIDKTTGLEYIRIPLNQDYGDFKKSVYLIPEKYVAHKDNDYSEKPAYRSLSGLKPPHPSQRSSFSKERFGQFLESLFEEEEEEDSSWSFDFNWPWENPGLLDRSSN